MRSGSKLLAVKADQLCDEHEIHFRRLSNSAENHTRRWGALKLDRGVQWNRKLSRSEDLRNADALLPAMTISLLGWALAP